MLVPMAVTGAGWPRFTGALVSLSLVMVACTGSPEEPAGVGPSPIAGAPSALARSLSRAVTVPGIRRHQLALQRIADRSNGNRAAGLPGYRRSVRYVSRRLRQAGYRVTHNQVRLDAWGEARPTQVGPAGGPPVPPAQFSLVAYSGGGRVAGPVTPVDRAGASSGCDQDDFDGFEPGGIALLVNANCAFLEQAVNAESAGARGVVIAAPEVAGREAPVLPGSLGAGSGVDIPVVAASETAGAAIGRLAGSGRRLEISARVVRGTRTARSVLADRPGKTDRVVMAGGHLDSVGNGPGINDNGSGVAALLEIALRLARLDPSTRNGVRFGFWAAEEEGLIGSTAYLSDLTPAQIDDIALYLNFDMLGSPNFVRYVYDIVGSDPGTSYERGTAAIEARFGRYFARKKLPTGPIPLAGRSDHAAFSAAGIPVGGLFSGAEGTKTRAEAEAFGGDPGRPHDPCYHLACDTFDNVSRLGLGQLAHAAAHALGTYADQPHPPS